MTIQELEKKIHEYIAKIYKAEFKGLLEVAHKDGVYILTLGVPSPDISTSISLQTENEQDFLDYIEKELINRDYMRVYYYGIRRVEGLKAKAKLIKGNEIY